MNDWDRAIDRHIRNRPERNHFPPGRGGDEQFLEANARYLDVLSRTAKRFGISLSSLPEGCVNDNENGLTRRTRTFRQEGGK